MVKPRHTEAPMVVIRAEGKNLAPLVLCDACHEQIKGDGWMWVLGTADGHARTGEAFATHRMCTGIFEAQNPEPPGWTWARADIHELLALLADNTRGTGEKVPVVMKRPH